MPDSFLGVFEEPYFSSELRKLIPDEELREILLEGLTFVLSHDPMLGQLTDQPGILAIPTTELYHSDGLQPLVIYYFFDDQNVYLKDVIVARQ